MTDSILNCSPKISVETWKTFNMKVVENFELYTFCFKHQFIWDLIQKLIWKPDENTLSIDSSLNSNFLQLLYGNLKIFEHESCSTLKMLQLWFWAKPYLSNNFGVMPPVPFICILEMLLFHALIMIRDIYTCIF